MDDALRTVGSDLVARWFVENGLPAPYTTRDLEDLARRIDQAIGEAIGKYPNPRWTA